MTSNLSPRNAAPAARDARAKYYMQTLIMLVVLAGCAQPEHGYPQAPIGAEDTSIPFPTAHDLIPAAMEAAKLWDSSAQLVMIATFEGQVLGDSRLIEGENRWVAPYVNANDPIGDGRAALWSFSFAAPGPDDDVARAVCGQGVHVEVREVHVVTLDANGTVVASYETRNDDEGAVPRGAIPTEWMDSAAAAQVALDETAMADWAAGATWSRVYLNAGWNWPGPAWTFSFDSPDERHVVAVDAVSGEILADDQIPAPPC